MDRKVAGVLALVLAVGAVLFVPRLINPGLPGTASAAPMPSPPPIGSCVSFVGRPMRVVGCDEPHQGEITAVWAAEDPARAVEATSTQCDVANAAYIGIQQPVEMNDWTVAALFWETQLVRAPRTQRIGEYGWQACVLRSPDRAEYAGSVRGLGDLTARPDVFGNCQTGNYEFTVCSVPHGSELLAYTDGVWYDIQTGLPAGSRIEVIHDVLNGGCRTLAETLTGATDPTYGGRLRIEVWIEQVAQQQVTYDQSLYATSYRASCQLTAVDGELTGSVIGLGDAELPIR